MVYRKDKSLQGLADRIICPNVGDIRIGIGFVVDSFILAVSLYLSKIYK